MARLRAEGWRERREERRPTNITAKVIRSNGASLNVTIADITGEGLRLEGVDGLTIGEAVLLLLPTHQTHEITIRWSVGDQAGARFVG